jgi:hypothetical protein
MRAVESPAVTRYHRGMGRAPGQIATTIYLPKPLYDWLKGRQVHEVDEYGRQLSMTRIIARYCQQARQRIEQEADSERP